MAQDSFVGEALSDSPYFEKCKEVQMLIEDRATIDSIVNGAITMLNYGKDRNDWSLVHNALFALSKIQSEEVIKSFRSEEWKQNNG